MSADDFLARLEKADDEDDVRRRIAGRLYNENHTRLANEWLRKREQAREDERLARAEKREEENLEISRKALSNSKSATRAAYWALGISLTLAVIEVIQWYMERGT